MNKLKMLDLFCGAGGAGMGYSDVGFEVVGIDVSYQENYPFEFHQADALEYLEKHGHEFDLIHASPPCQSYSCLAHLSNGIHKAMIPETRELLIKIGKPFVIENVQGAPLIDPVILCGSMFNLKTPCGAKLRRHRLFETSFKVEKLKCSHIKKERTIGIFGDKARDTAAEKRHYSKPKETRGGPPKDILFSHEYARISMEIDWMTIKELSQAIPPAYTEYTGKEFLKILS